MYLKQKILIFIVLKPEAVTRRCSVKKVFLKISQNIQENSSARVSFLIKLQAGRLQLIKKRLWHWCFPVNFTKFVTTPYICNISYITPPVVASVKLTFLLFFFSHLTTFSENFKRRILEFVLSTNNVTLGFPWRNACA